MSKKVIYYLNQFFGQIGGEETAHHEIEIREGGVGPAASFSNMLKDADAEVTHTIIAGDNYFNENKEEACEFLEKVYEDHKPDLVVAGPAFNAGRYGMACAGVAEVFAAHGVPVVTGMFEENPGVDAAKTVSYIVRAGESAADMRNALPAMAQVATKILNGETVRPEEDNYIPQGRRETVLVEDIGARRAVDMLLKRLNDEEFETELPMPEFDVVDPAPAIKDISKATIALVTTGGIVPLGNPDRVQSASAQKWAKYDVSGIDTLKGEYETIHGGYDPSFANEDPDRVVPLDELKRMEKDGEIGSVYKYFYTTTGTGTAVGASIKFGEEIGQELLDAGVDGVILTST